MVALRRDVDPASRFRAEGVEERCVVALADLTDHDALIRVLNEHEVSDVFHLAAQTLVGSAQRSPLATWEANVQGTWCLLEACRDAGHGAARGGGLVGQGLRRPRRAALPRGLRAAAALPL